MTTTAPLRCPTCGALITLEMRRGRVVDYCPGCWRNRQRADMGLPPLDFAPKESYEPEASKRNGQFPGKVQPRPSRPTGPRPRTDRGIARVEAKLPRHRHTACTGREIAYAIGISEQAVNLHLHTLERAGKAVRHKPAHARRAGWMWYRAAA